MNEHSRPGLLRNIRIGFGLSMLILILSSIASFSSIRTLLDSSKWVDHTDSVINNLESALSTLKDAETGQRGFLLTGDSAFLLPYNGAQERALARIDSIRVMTADNPVQQVNVAGLRNVLTQRLTVLQQIIDQKMTTNVFSVDDLKKGRVYMDQARQIVQKMMDEEHRLLVLRTEKMKRFAAYTPILIGLAALLSLIITIFFYRRISLDYRERTHLYEELRQKDEETAQRISIISSIADKVSEGDYGIRVTDEQKDGLGSLSGSLNKMAGSLEYSFGLLSDKEWLQTGIARLNEVMVGETDMHTLVSNILGFIVNYTHSLVGALYVLEADGHTMTLKGSHALASNDRRLRIRSGEGIIGQAAADGKKVLLTGLSAAEWTLSLAAGDIRPASLIAFPFFFEGKVKGVIELGALRNWSDREFDFFNSIVENVGAVINRMETRMKLQELLEETQAQTEELQAQHSELENLNMELEMQAEKLQASEEELRVQQEELQQTNLELEERSRSLEEKNELVLLRNLDIQQKAEELSLSAGYKSEFMANMSHELRTPLNSILLLSKLLSENKPANLAAEQVEYARVIQHSGQGLLELIDEILDLSRIESGKLQPELALVSIAGIVEDMRMLFVPLARDKSLEIRFDIHEDTPAQLETDKMRLEQILKNLLSNAFKFTPGRGIVTLSIAPSTGSEHFIDFSVRDNGIGIPADKHEIVFEAFQQADGSTRRKYGGTGLGLSISRELAKLLGGAIRLTSVPGEGSEFIVSIPLFRTTASAANHSSSRAPGISSGAPGLLPENPTSGSPPFPLYTLKEGPPEIPDDRHHLARTDKVLMIVEDDTVFATMLLEFSRQKGYKGIVAVSGDTAIRLAKIFRPMGILLDIQLPVKNGWEVMEELKKDPLTRHIPVHIISSYEVKNESLLKGAIDFIHKPVTLEGMDSVFEKIGYALSRNPRKAVIVEDNTKHAKALAWFLASNEVQVEIAGTIPDCAALLKKTTVDSVILDMGVNGMNVYDALDEIRKDPGLKDIPIIVFTGKTITRGEELRIRSHADSVVVKTAWSYQRILDEISLFLHLMDEDGDKSRKKVFSRLGALEEVLKGKVVLVADDDVRNIYSLTKALENHRMQVRSAMDGKEALAIMEESSMPVDIVLMDMMMPEMDGYESIALIRKDPRYRNLPIIAVTAKAMPGDREKCMQAGASDYISKPVDIDQLLSLLRIWLYEK
jgi:signal transduction histidine kinase/DNA-binding response OmpR family regulator/CHASE3 domain sensor protein